MDAIPFKDIFFYITAIVMVAGAFLTVLAKNILHSAVALIGVFFGTAVLYFLLSAEFIAVAQVMVYIGGVVVFIVFAILLTSRLGEKVLETRTLRKVVAAFFGITIAVLAVFILREAHGGLVIEENEFATLAAIGKRLLSPESNGFLLPFEAISLLLLISLIGAVSIARTPQDDKDKEAK
ncbi:MAG: NADH-quinone oxidoreductase subunit J [Fibromonadaceae bacterium]|jgi:NADH-quinone oxidoreductase subunit J|nr:NADH-quinone oxidoreductase subunit J [Fibromonadaceae bacterium]